MFIAVNITPQKFEAFSVSQTIYDILYQNSQVQITNAER